MPVQLPPPNPLTLLFARLVLTVLAVSGTTGIRLSSWFRTPEENARVGGVPSSLHVAGLAVDLVGPPQGLARIAAIWRAIGLTAIDETDHLHLELD